MLRKVSKIIEELYRKPFNTFSKHHQNAAWNRYKFSIKNRKIRYGFVPHIDKEFFGIGKDL